MGQIRLRRARRTARSLGILALVPLLATACATQNQGTRLGFPEPTTTQGETMLSLWVGSWVAAFAVGAVVWGLIIWACVFHRKKTEDLPKQVRYNVPIEVLYTVVPIIIVAVLFVFTVRDQNEVNALHGDPGVAAPDVKVKVEAFQWSWRFTTTYGDKVTKPVVGKPAAEYSGGPQLVLPTKANVEFDLVAPTQDVIHSFWVPAFHFKRDVLPGEKDERQRKFQITTLDRTGTFAGRCAELCGTLHSRMLFSVKLTSMDEFVEYVNSNAEVAQ